MRLSKEDGQLFYKLWLVMPYNVIMGSGIKRTLKDVYMSAKKSGQIHRIL